MGHALDQHASLLGAFVYVTSAFSLHLAVDMCDI